METKQKIYNFAVVIPAVMYLVASIITFEGNSRPIPLTLLIYSLPIIGFLVSVKCLSASKIPSEKIAYGIFSAVYVFLAAVTIYIDI